jgi:hypothetical protein
MVDSFENGASQIHIVKSISRNELMDCYLTDFAHIIGINTELQRRVVLALWQASKGSNKPFTLLKANKIELQKQLNITGGKVEYTSLHNVITKLYKQGVLVRISRAVYKLNPTYFNTIPPHTFKATVYYKII